MSSAWRTTFTFSSRLFALEAEAAGFTAAEPAGLVTAIGFALGIGAGFTTRGGGPAAGLLPCFAPAGPVIPSAALESAVFCCCAVFNLSWTLLMMFGFCAQTAPVIMAAVKMLVISFICDSYLPTPGVLAPGPAPAGSRS